MFTDSNKSCLPVNMKKFGQRNVRKHKEIKGSDRCVTLNMYEILNISEKFDDPDKMKTTSSESKGNLGRSGKGLLTALVLKTNARSEKYKKARYAIVNVSKKDLFKIIKEFEIFDKLPYEKKRPNNEPTHIYFHLARHITKCMMRSNNLNWQNHSNSIL